MKIIQVTDLHLAPPGETVFGLDPLARLDACIADINRHHADADAVVISGDLTNNGDRSAYEALNDRLSGLIPPCRLMMGNHDDRALFREIFPDEPHSDGFIQSIVDHEDVRLILLDTLETGHVEGHLCAVRRDWLDEKLREAGDRPTFVFMHHPPFDLHMPELDRVKLADADKFHELLARHGNVRHIFAGHVHRPVAGNWRGISVSTLPSTNHQTALDFSDNYATTHEPPAYAVIFADRDSVVVHFHDFIG